MNRVTRTGACLLGLAIGATAMRAQVVVGDGSATTVSFVNAVTGAGMLNHTSGPA